MIDWIKSLFKPSMPRPETISIENFIVSLEYEIKDLHSLIDMEFRNLEHLDRHNNMPVKWQEGENPFDSVMQYAKYRIDILGIIDVYNERIKFNKNLIQLIKK